MDRTHQHITNQTIYAPVTPDHPFFLLFLPHSIITCPPQHQLSQLVHHNIIHQIPTATLYLSKASTCTIFSLKTRGSYPTKLKKPTNMHSHQLTTPSTHGHQSYNTP